MRDIDDLLNEARGAEASKLRAVLFSFGDDEAGPIAYIDETALRFRVTGRPINYDPKTLERVTPADPVVDLRHVERDGYITIEPRRRGFMWRDQYWRVRLTPKGVGLWRMLYG